MNIRQLQYFCAVVRFGSFSRAAQDREVSVQAVSKAIVELEGEFGRPLFSRSSKGVVPTSFGRAMAGRIEWAVEAYEAVERVAITGGEEFAAKEGALRTMLVAPSFPHEAHLCASFSRMFSGSMGFKVELRTGLGKEAFDLLLSDGLDAFFTIGRFEHPSCETFSVGTLPAGVFLSANHPLADKRELTFEDLGPYPVGMTAGVDDFNETVVNLYRAAGLKSKPRALSSKSQAQDLLDQDDGFVMGIGIRAFEVPPHAVMHLIHPSCAVPVQICMVTLKDSCSEKCQTFKHFMRSEFTEMMKGLAL